MVIGFGDPCIREKEKQGGAFGCLGGIYRRWYESTGVAQGDDLEAKWAGGQVWSLGQDELSADTVGYWEDPEA